MKFASTSISSTPGTSRWKPTAVKLPSLFGGSSLSTSDDRAKIDGAVVSSYLLDDQASGEDRQTRWGVPVIRSETENLFIEYIFVVETRATEDGIVCEFSIKDEPGDDPGFKNALFIPFEYRTPPAPNAVGCEVDGTFFLLFDDLQKGPHP